MDETKSKSLTWQELEEKNPKAFRKLMESAMDYVCEELVIEIEGTTLITDGCFTGSEYGGTIKQMWNGEDWEEVEPADYDPDEDEDEEDEDE